MTAATRHDAWNAGDSYDAYMGRWSRRLAPRFIDWLDPAAGLDWLEVGCGTGALSAAIAAQASPRSLLAIDASEGFLAKARTNVPDARADFRKGDAQALDIETESRDIVVSALMLNFVPDTAKALAEMKRVARRGGTLAFYVWDYPGRGVEFMRAFWDAATALDASAADLTEDKRFPFCNPAGLVALSDRAGLKSAECTPLEIPTVFESFEDYWRPFTLGAGPAPGYCAALPADGRSRLRQRLQDTLPRSEDGSIPLKARAWALRAVVP
jgi:SAM-dependent methyltransferase